MKILITGAKGLIGTELIKALYKIQISLNLFDHKFSLDNPDYGDILNIEQLRKAMQDCDGIVHLAAVSRVIWGEQDPELCWKTNNGGTANVIQLALAEPKKPWILYASSREVYGTQNSLPVKENTPIAPINIYGKSKAAAETAILNARKNGLSTAIVRFSHVYGSVEDHPDRVLPAFCRAAAQGFPLMVEGKDNTFDFTHVSDTAVGIVKIIQRLIRNESALPPLHLTTGKETSLWQAATLAVQAGGNHSSIVEAPSRHFDVSNFYGDSTETMRILDWIPKVSVEVGIENLTNAFRESLGLQKKRDIS